MFWWEDKSKHKSSQHLFYSEFQSSGIWIEELLPSWKVSDSDPQVWFWTKAGHRKQWEEGRENVGNGREEEHDTASQHLWALGWSLSHPSEGKKTSRLQAHSNHFGHSFIFKGHLSGTVHPPDIVLSTGTNTKNNIIMAPSLQGSQYNGKYKRRNQEWQPAIGKVMIVAIPNQSSPHLSDLI